MPICRLALLVIVALIGLGAPNTVRAQGAGQEVTGVALVVGNENYDTLPNVPGATTDAASVGVYLRQLGLEVQQYVDLTQGELLAASQRFIKELRPGQLAVVYFSGHVFQLNGSNFLIPINARLDRPTSLLSSGLPLNTLIVRIDRMDLAQAMFFLEAGLAVDPTGDGALASGMAEPPEMTVPSVFALSVEPGQTIAVADPTLGDFTARILEQATTPGVSLQQAIETARSELSALRGNSPPPWVRDTLDAPMVMMPVPAQPGVDVSEQRIWDAVQEQPDDGQRYTALVIYLQLYPNGAYAQEAARMVAALESVLQPDDDGGVVTDGGTDGDAAPDAGAGDAGTGDGPDVVASTDGDGGAAGDQGTGDEGTDGGEDGGPDDTPEAAEVNQPPSFAVPEDAVVLIAGGEPVTPDLPDPTDPDGDALTVEVVALPGPVTVSSGGAPLAVGDVLTVDQLDDLTFSAGAQADGDQALVLSISDGAGGSIEARIAVRVDPAPVNRPPVGVDLQPLEVASDAGPVDLTIPPPTDPDGDLLTLVVDELPRFGVIRAGSSPIALRESIPVEELGSLNYVPSRSQAGDAGAFVLAVSDTHDNAIRLRLAITVTAAPTPEGAKPWNPSAAGQADARMAQSALRSLGFYDGPLDGIFGRGSQAALAAYQDSIGAEPTGTMILRERAELAAAGAQAAAVAARGVADEAEAAAERAHELAASEDAQEINYSIGVYRGEVSGNAANGYGVIQAQGGQSFAGLFENNARKLGVYVFREGDRYVGQIADELPDGLGVRYLDDGWEFAGQWSGGTVEGLGVSEAAAGATVAGEWVDNQLSGYGAVVDDQNGRRVGVMEASTFTALY